MRFRDEVRSEAPDLPPRQPCAHQNALGRIDALVDRGPERVQLGELVSGAVRKQQAHGLEPVAEPLGDAGAQLVVLAMPAVDPVEVEELPESERGVRGFGSSAV